MTENIEKRLKELTDKSYIVYRTKEEEFPIAYPEDLFGYHLGVNRRPSAACGNVTPNYKRVITKGFDAIRSEIVEKLSEAESDEKRVFGEKMLACLDQCIEISDKYREDVKKSGNIRLYQTLTKIPHKGAETFYEACVFINMCNYFIRTNRANHIGLGRFDQYMYSFYKNDIANGVTKEEIFETLEAFFISLNYDTDLYCGIQKGDNGQSMILGGVDRDGNDAYNELSEMCLDASLELNLIDPKINLRVGKNTPDHIYIKGTELTKKGLGFPQYSNDDIVIPGLVKLGYDIEDARDYTVAACWEFIIPNCGADMPNIATFNFPLVINDVIHQKLGQCSDFSELMSAVESEISDTCDKIVENYTYVYEVSPLLSIFFDGCIETLTDMWRGGTKYLNYGSHGAGIANAADALAAVKKVIFDEKSVTVGELLDALDKNFEGYSTLKNRLQNCPKMGNNDSYVDDISVFLMSCFSKYLNNRAMDTAVCGGQEREVHMSIF